MADYLRVLRRYSHWPQAGQPEWTPDALEDLLEDEVSVFRVESERALELVLLGFSAGRRNPKHLDYVLFSEEQLVAVGGTLRHTPDNCSLPLAFVRAAHHDLTGMTQEGAERLLKEPGQVARRYPQRDLVSLALRARQEGWPEVSPQEWEQMPSWLRG